MTDQQSILNQILSQRPPVHTRASGENRCIGMHNEVLQYLYDQLHPGQLTLETGCGLSTLVFALSNCIHKVIVPNAAHIEATKQAAIRYDIPFDDTTFILGRSEKVLPAFSTETKLDAVLIDGGHAFPIPFIDWFYTNNLLRVNGLLVLDDIDLKSVSILDDYLSSQPEWQKDKVIRRTAFYIKIHDLDIDDAWDYWQKQPFNRGLGLNFRKIWLNLRYRK